MKFTGTRSDCSIESSRAITQGIAADGGLFVPREFPQFSSEQVRALIDMSYQERAEEVLSMYLTDYTREELKNCVTRAYSGTFENNEPAPLVKIGDSLNILELWHGPTCAFKDMALQLLPSLLTTAAGKVAPGRTMVILVATSGDTGKAALEGFADVKNTRIIVFYPQDGVSPMQKLQMTTQRGKNVEVAGIEGNFDDAQSGVKSIFGDEEMRKFLAERNMEFSSANSINFGRLVPQIVYYVSAWCDMLKNQTLKMGQSFNIAVPTGNFGNILAAVYAKYMGVPVNKFICASNKNCILTDFIRTGVYDRNRPFFTTSSPSMDILISSNLERLLFHLYGNNPEPVRKHMAELKEDGRYIVSQEILAKLQSDFYGGWCDEKETSKTIRDAFLSHHYLCDTHTAVGMNVYQQYVEETGDTRPCVLASTASPYKFAASVLPAIKPGADSIDGFQMLDDLALASETKVPMPLASLREYKILHPARIAREDMSGFIRDFLSK